MKAGLEGINELAEELARQRDAQHDFIADTRELTMLTVQEDPDEPRFSELNLPGQGEYRINPYAHMQIATRLQIPLPYYRRIQESHPALLDHNVNTLFREAPERRMVRAFDYGGDDRFVRAFLSAKYRRLDNWPLANAILPIIGEIPDVQIASCDVTDRRMYIKALSPRTQGEIGVGDVVQAGVVISNSEVGQGYLQVQSLVYRLICDNGMIMPATMKRMHVGRTDDSDEVIKVLSAETLRKEDEVFFDKVVDVTKAAVSEARFQEIVSQMREARSGVKMEKPMEGMEKLAKAFDLNDGEKDGILGHLVDGGDLSRYGTLNAVTRFSQDVENYDRATELEELGGRILELPGKEWRSLVTV